MIYILMGVSGSGKTLIGQELAGRLDILFYDADDFHPPENVEKMKSGQSLNDHDRKPWLQNLRQKIIQWEQNGSAVLACSALKKSYRDLLASSDSSTQFIYLKGPREVIARRMQKRSSHFMPDELLDSQFQTLEEPADALTVDIRPTPKKIIENILHQLNN